MVGDMFNVTQNNPDFWRNLMQFGFSTMSAANKPGASTLGALGEGGMATTEAARQNALARAQSEYYGQNTLSKQLENQAALYDMNLDRRALGQPQIGEDLTPRMDTGSPSMSRTPNVGMLPQQPGTDTRPVSSEDTLLRIARGNVSPRNVAEAESALAYTKKGSAKEKYLTDYIEANRFTGEKAKATLPYDLKKSYASANAGAEGQIARLVKTGISREKAISIVDGSSKVVVDPDTGNPFLVNIGTGTSEILMEPVSSAPSEAPSAGIPTKRTSLYELADKATGPVSSAADAWSSISAVADPWNILPFPEETMHARRTLDTASRQLVMRLQQSPRYAEGERKSLEKQFSISPSALQSPEALRVKMQADDAFLRDELSLAEQQSVDRTLPKEVRKAAREDASAIKYYLKRMDVPQSDKSLTTSAPVSKGGGKSLSDIWGD